MPLPFRGKEDQHHQDVSIGPKEQSATPNFTAKQGQYLAFIYWFTKLNRQPPAEADMQRFFQVTPPSVHQMVVTLTNKGLITRQLGKGRTIELKVEAIGTSRHPARVRPRPLERRGQLAGCHSRLL